MIYDYPKPAVQPLHGAQSELELIESGFVPCEFIPIDAQDEPSLDPTQKTHMFYFKDGLEAGWVGFPDPKILKQLLADGRISWRIAPHRSNPHVKVRLYELAKGREPIR